MTNKVTGHKKEYNGVWDCTEESRKNKKNESSEENKKLSQTCHCIQETEKMETKIVCHFSYPVLIQLMLMISVTCIRKIPNDLRFKCHASYKIGTKRLELSMFINSLLHDRKQLDMLQH